MNQEPNFENNTKDIPQEKRCPVCGKPASPDALFCGECGHSFEAGHTPAAMPRDPYAQEDTAPLKTSDYLLMFVVSSLPFVGFILMLIWGFSSGVNVHRRNFCRAYLIFTVIVWLLTMLLSYVMMVSGMAIPYY